MGASGTPSAYIEPWLRGTHTDVPAVGRAVLHALELALDDIEKWTEGLSEAEVHSQPLGLPSVAFQIKHIAGSVDRILTYAEGNPLTREQLAALKSEAEGDGTLEQILSALKISFEHAAARVRTLASADLEAFRGVGRKQLPTTVGGALVHVADHTQRHVGQLVIAVKVLRALRG